MKEKLNFGGGRILSLTPQLETRKGEPFLFTSSLATFRHLLWHPNLSLSNTIWLGRCFPTVFFAPSISQGIPHNGQRMDAGSALETDGIFRGVLSRHDAASCLQREAGRHRLPPASGAFVRLLNMFLFTFPAVPLKWCIKLW